MIFKSISKYIKNSGVIPALTLLLILVACDEGRIYPDEQTIEQVGMEVHLQAAITGFDTWPEGYTISLAGFAEDGEYAVISKNIVASDSEGPQETILTNIPSEAVKAELCVIDRLRRRVATFATIDLSAGNRVNELTLGKVDMSMDAAVQNEIFSTTCANCHGGSGYAAAGLHLTPGLSRNEMFGVESVKSPGHMRVAEGNPEESVLYEILTSDVSSDWNYDHSREIYNQVKLDLIKNWILK